MEYDDYLPSIILPNHGQNSTIIKESKSSFTKKIKTLVEDMNKRQTRTTNFAIIVYLVKNEFKKMSLKNLIENIKRDFEGHKAIFLNSVTKKPFEEEIKVLNSIKSSVNRNKSFNFEKNNGEKYISLNLERTLEYLEKMHQKYINKELDISSISSADSPKKINVQSEEEEEDKKLLGYKTLRKKQKKKYPKQKKMDSLDSFDSFDVISEEKSLSTYKFLKENLKPKFNDICSKKRINDRKNKSKEKYIDNVFDKDFSFHIKNCDVRSFAEKNQNGITNSLNAVNESINILISYKKKLKNLQTKIEERDKNLEEFNKVQNKLIKEKNDLKVLYQVLELKYEYIKNIKKSKYLGDIFEQTKPNLELYKTLIYSKIKNFKYNLKKSISLEKAIKEDNELLNESDSIMLDDNINNKGLDEISEYMVKKDYCCLLNNIRIDCIENGNNDYYEENNNEIVSIIETKMNELWKKIKEEK